MLGLKIGAFFIIVYIVENVSYIFMFTSIERNQTLFSSNTHLINIAGKLEYCKEQCTYIILFKLISLKSLSFLYFIKKKPLHKN